MKVLILGAGASGMMAALTASERADCQVILLERQARVGRKLLATGNGRCNLTNRELSPAHYHGQQADFCAYALRRFGVEETLRFFRSLGLLTVTESNGRVYPYSDSANSVADVLRLTLEQRENVQIVTGAEVTALARNGGGFLAETAAGRFDADRVIVCTGGVAGEKLGGNPSGYRLLGGFGHTRTKLLPALVQLRTETEQIRALKGVRCTAQVRFGALQRSGEVQFTDYGVSGPVIFELSREAAVSGGGTLEFDFLPHVSEAELLELLQARCAALPKLKAADLLTGALHNRLGRALLLACGESLETPCGAFSAARLRAICARVKRFCLPVLGTMGMDGAQVTAGGIRTAEFYETLESRLCPGLYAAGEVLDVDGDCGGYNLQWAWSSGRLAGQLEERR